MRAYRVKWLWERSASMLAVFVLGSLVLGWFLPATYDLVVTFGICQMLMAVVVLVRESMSYAKRPSP